MIEVFIDALASLTQYYDQPLRCFTFGDFQLVPIVEEFEEILEEESLYGKNSHIFFLGSTPLWKE